MNKNNKNVISSRLELVRNISGFRFVPTMNEKDASVCLEKVTNALRYHEKAFYPVNCSKRNLAMYLHLYEKGLAALPFPDERFPDYLFVRDDQELSVQVNCVEHISVRSATYGLGFDSIFGEIYSIEHHLQKFMDFNFTPGTGYSACRPDYAGTGLKASVMLHLPSIVKTNALNHAAKLAQDSGLVLKPAYPEKKAANSSLFILENRNCRDLTENELIGLVCDSCKEICSMEEQSMICLKQNASEKFRVCIDNARHFLNENNEMNEVTFINMLSDVLFVAESGMFDTIPSESISKLLFEGMTGGIIKDKLKVDPKFSVDKLRSDLIKDRLFQEDRFQ